MNEYYVYLHTRFDGTPFYVGKGKGKRAYSKSRRNQYWNNIVNKDDGFVVTFVKQNLTNEEACALEKQTIAEYGFDNLTNMTAGGNGGDTRQNYTNEEYEEWLSKKSQAQTGKVGYWRGKPRPKHSDTLTNLHKSGKFNYEHFKKPKSKQHAKKISESLKGIKRPKVICEICGASITKNNLGQHQAGSKCK